MTTKTKIVNPERQTRALVYFSLEQRKQLRAAARRANTSQAALFRRGIELVLAEIAKKGQH